MSADAAAIAAFEAWKALRIAKGWADHPFVQQHYDDMPSLVSMICDSCEQNKLSVPHSAHMLPWAELPENARAEWRSIAEAAAKAWAIRGTMPRGDLVIFDEEPPNAD